MSLKDSNWCVRITTGLIIFTAIFNGVFGTNYISTNKMPAHLINYLGINLPSWLCMPAVIFGYAIVTYFQYWASNKAIQVTEDRRNRAKLKRMNESIEVE